MADINVSVALLLENQAELSRALEAAGGKIGKDFADRLSAETAKAFEEVQRQAERAAKEAGLRFNRQEFRFEKPTGQIIPQAELDRISRIKPGLREAAQAVDVFRAATVQAANETTQAVKKTERGFDLLEAAITGVAVSLTSRLTDAAGTALGSVRGLVSGFLELDGELRLAAAAAGEQGGYERLGKIVDAVGIEAAGTTKQVAELATSLVRAGFSVSEVEGALPGVVKGAEATGTSFEQFGEIVGNTLRGFGLEVDQTARVVDVLTNTANSSNASISGLGYTFEYTAPIAKALGVSLEDVAAATGLMANAGIQGSVAGTGLRTGLQKLQQAAGGASPEVMGLTRGQERLAAVMRKLGATVIDSSGKMLPLEQVLLRLKAGLEKLNQADQVQLANVLFGDEAGSKFLAITNQSNAAISKMFADIRNSTGATNTARNAMAGMGLELQQLTGTLDSLRNNLGGVLAAGLRPLVQVANALVGAISAMPGPVKNTAGAIVGLGIAATGAAVAVGALNVVVAQVGGWVALRTAIAGAAAVITGPLGAGTVILLGVAAAAGVLFGTFRETDRTTRTLVQTMVGLGAAVAILRGLAVAQALWNSQLLRTVVLKSIENGLSAKGIAQLALAAGAGVLAYKLVGDAIKVTGEETQALTEKAGKLKGELTDLQKQLAEEKRLNMNTDDTQRRIEILELRLRQIEDPLELKVDVEKAKAKVKELEEQVKKLPTEDRRKPLMQAQLESAQRYQKILEQIDQRQATAGSPVVRELGNNMREIETRIAELFSKKMSLPFTAKLKREEIDREIALLERQRDLRKLRLRIELDAESAKAQYDSLNATIFEDQALGIDTTEMQAQLRPLQLLMRQLGLERIQNEKDLAATLDQREAKEAAKVRTAQEQLAAAKAKLETEEAGLAVQQKATELDSNRLRLVQQVADAYASLANAQAGLAQSGFDVEKSRNGQRLALAEKELQFLRDRGAAAGPIQAAEERIAAIKRDGEAIEFRAMQASIQAMTQRFEIERRVLELKQRAERIDQQNAIRQAEIGVNREKQQLVKLKTDALAPGLTSDQKQSLAKQIELQNESVRLAMQLKQAEMDRLAVQPMLQAMQRAGQEAQQQTSSNQARGAAAAKGWEEAMSGFLGKADEAAGATNRLAAEAKVFYGTLELNGKRIPIFDVVKQLPTPLGLLTETTQKMSDKIQEAVTQQKALTDEVSLTADAYAALNERVLSFLQNSGKLVAKPTARWAGGDVTPGNAYQVNELGTEAFLSRSGALSLISAPAFGTWSPPSAGMVLPAGLTQQLEAMGAFSGSGMAAPRLAAIAPPPSSSSSGGRQVAVLARLQRSIDRLEGTMRSYSPTVNVTLPGNAGLLHTLQSFR